MARQCAMLLGNVMEQVTPPARLWCRNLPRNLTCPLPPSLAPLPRLPRPLFRTALLLLFNPPFWRLHIPNFAILQTRAALDADSALAGFRADSTGDLADIFASFKQSDRRASQVRTSTLGL